MYKSYLPLVLQKTKSYLPLKKIARVTSPKETLGIVMLVM